MEILRRFRDWLRPHLQGAVDGLDLPVSSKLRQQSVPETMEEFHTLTGLSVQEDFIEWFYVVTEEKNSNNSSKAYDVTYLVTG